MRLLRPYTRCARADSATRSTMPTLAVSPLPNGSNQGHHQNSVVARHGAVQVAVSAVLRDRTCERAPDEYAVHRRGAAVEAGTSRRSLAWPLGGRGRIGPVVIS